jgi:hypothetical protein
LKRSWSPIGIECYDLAIENQLTRWKRAHRIDYFGYGVGDVEQAASVHVNALIASMHLNPRSVEFPFDCDGVARRERIGNGRRRIRKHWLYGSEYLQIILIESCFAISERGLSNNSKISRHHRGPANFIGGDRGCFCDGFCENSLECALPHFANEQA